MRLRRGVPSSYEVEPDRIVVTSLDDTSSSEGDGSSEADGQKTPDADTSTESKDSSSDFVINNELMEKLEAHSRAVLTGTSDRDNAASNSRSGGYASPINAEDARGALILWKDPEEVLKSTSAATIPSPLKPSDLATVPESGPAPTSFMNQPPVSFQSGSSFSAPASNSSSMFGNTIPSLPSAHQVHQHTHAAGAQPIDLSGCFGPAEEMDLDS
uniref:Uncharacterized protein n=1 Tax=Kalmanozyma brasiliensis (strain GHG001) TaxID=1365824 RepID=V5EXU7_KALBG